MRRRAASGFTLIELVFSLSIVAIIVTMLFTRSEGRGSP